MSQPSFIQNLAQTLRQPPWLGTFASIGVHGLLWVVLPILPISSNTPEQERRTVQLVELTPEELGRVPQFTQPQNLFPNNPIQGNILPPSSPLTQPAPLPPPIDPSLLYPLPITPPPNIWSPLPNTFDPRPELNQKPITRKIEPERTDDKPAPKPNNEETAKNTPNSTTPTPKPTETTEPKPEETTKPTPPVRPEKLSPEKIAQLRQEAQKQVQQKVGYNPGRQTNDNKVYNNNIQAFTPYFEELVKKIPKDQQLEEEKYSPEKISFYPEEACPYKLNGDVEIWALVKPNGEVEGEPQIARYSAFGLLDDAALNYVRGTTFKASDKYEIRQFRFEFKPSEAVCSAGTASAG
jgi:hypothetical protein